MEREEFFKRQPRFAKILENARAHERVSQAYLLYGSPRCPFEETALFAAQTLQCEGGGLACGECPSCLRFLKGVRPDFTLIDGKQGLIKKEEVLALREKYALTSVQNKRSEAQRISYAILAADNILPKVANAMLKFLEEPVPGLTALLLTSNVERMLPTIRSRCEEVRLDAIPREELYRALIEKGYGEEVCYFLSDLSGDASWLERLAQEEGFLSAVSALNEFIQAYDRSPKEAIYSLMRDAGENLKGAQCYNAFYGGLSRFFKDVMTQGGRFSLYRDSIERHREDAATASKVALLLDESIKESNANMAFSGILARLGTVLLG